MALKRLPPRSQAPVTLAQAKEHIRVEHSLDDGLIELYIKAAVSHIEGNNGVIGRALVNQQWELAYDCFPDGALEIPLGPLVSVDRVEYVDPDTGIMTLWPDTNYVVDNHSWQGWIAPVDGWPATRQTLNAARVTFVAGHGENPADVPADLQLAILHMVGHWYENRESVSDITKLVVPETAHALIGAKRKIPI